MTTEELIKRDNAITVPIGPGDIVYVEQLKTRCRVFHVFDGVAKLQCLDGNQQKTFILLPVNKLTRVPN